MKGLLQNYFIKAYSPMGVTRTVALVYSFPINASAGKRTESLENVEGKSEGLLIRRFGFHSTHRKFEIWRELKSWRLTNCVKRYIIYNTSYLSSNFQFNILYFFGQCLPHKGNDFWFGRCWSRQPRLLFIRTRWPWKVCVLF